MAAPNDNGVGARAMRVLLVIDELDVGGTEQQIVELVDDQKDAHRPRAHPVVVRSRHGPYAHTVETAWMTRRISSSVRWQCIGSAIVWSSAFSATG